MPSGVVSLANFRGSFANGYAFADDSAGAFQSYLNYRLVVADSAGKKAIGYIKAAGTGETYGSELLATWINSGDPYDTLTASGIDLTVAVNAAGTASAYNGSLTITAGVAHKIATSLTLNSGQAPTIFTATEAGVPIDNFGALSAGANSDYFTGLGTEKYLGLSNSDAADFACIFSMKQITAPSATGVTITSTPGGTTYNWASIEAGFNYNDPLGYSYVISPRNGLIGSMNVPRLFKRIR